ncbi:c-type cytochrome [Hydrotalea sp.]|uniref:c-type cytochrome n=1 Tax=Hydrotalea sp. TaxID=2881279 RepID=UPI0026276B39|nr:c-type cytochrome [Hydrotalea sp.]
MRKNGFIIILSLIVLIVLGIKVTEFYFHQQQEDKKIEAMLKADQVPEVWMGKSKSQIPAGTEEGTLILYGYNLITNTCSYFGPKGSVAPVTNGMNCQNCHLQAGTLPYGNNFGKAAANYPEYRARNNGWQSISARVNDCFERSMNGTPLDTNSHEMKAIVAYLQWIGKDVPKGTTPPGTGIKKIKMLDKAANPEAGKLVFTAHCQSCHGPNGQGLMNINGNGYTYPPLWGTNSYNDGAGMYRISTLAGFIQPNMPFGTNYHHPAISTEDAWNVAAYINSQPRPHINQSNDWKDIATKPFDFPFGPYADTFSGQQHKYGPYQPIIDAKKENTVMAVH